MNKKENKGPSKSAQKRKAITKDLKAKDAGSVKGGFGTVETIKINTPELKISSPELKISPPELKLNTPTG
jgi:hypothetical protein